jgi:two-component system cell cycle sensor histidine kinase/response regulator CckA
LPADGILVEGVALGGMEMRKDYKTGTPSQQHSILSDEPGQEIPKVSPNAGKQKLSVRTPNKPRPIQRYTDDALEFAEGIIDTVREPLIVLDHDLRVVTASRTFYDVFKVRPEETLGQLIYQLGNKQWDIPKLQALLETILPQKAIFENYEVEHDFATIGTRTMRLNARQIQRAAGKERIILLAIEDITERRKIEGDLGNALKELTAIERYTYDALEFAEGIIDTVREPLIVLDHDLRVVSVNRSFYEVFKLKPEETVGQLIYNIDNNQWDIPGLRKLLETILPEKTTFDNYEVEHNFASIGMRTMLLNARRIPNAVDKDKVILLAIEDVTDRRQAEKVLAEKSQRSLILAEEKYRMLVENINDMLYTLDNYGNITYVSPVVERFTKYKANDLVGKPFTPLIYPDDLPGLLDSFNRLVSGQLEPWEFRVVDKDGKVIFVRTSSRPLYENGQVTGFTCLMTDITDRRRLEEKRQMVEKLESVGLLAGGIAHDFNNILTSIVGNISLARMDAAPGSELFESLEQAEKASQRATALTKQLLTFSKGGAPVKNLASLAEILKDTAGFALSGSNVKCHLSIPDDLWHAEIDAGQVSQVIHNLVLNAQQAMPGGGSIELSAENLSLSAVQGSGEGLPIKEGNYIRVAVTDHGNGISAENIDKIFDPFFSTKQDGSGLGLATSFSIARQHSGHISVDSRLGSGSTFCLYLPASTETVCPKQDTKDVMIPVGKARILVMDDEEGVREVAGRMLKHMGYKDVEFAVDGAEVVKLYKAAMESGKPIAIVILDLTVLGGMGGEATIRELLKIDPGVKAIVSSGYIDDPVMARYKEHGFSAVVAKPYTLEHLRKGLQDVMG